MEISYDKFLGALASLQGSSVSGDGAVVKFQYAVEKLMPKELSSGKYKMLGGLLVTLAKEYFPLTSTDFYSKEADLRRLEQGMKDVLETVGFVLRQLAKSESDMDVVVRDTLLTLKPRLDKMARMKERFLYIALRPELKQQMLWAAELPKEIDAHLAKSETKNHTAVEEELLEYIIFKDEALMSQLFRTCPTPPENLSEHKEKTAVTTIQEIFIKILRLLARRCEGLGASFQDEMSMTLRQFLNFGILSEDHWRAFKGSRKKNEELERIWPAFIRSFDIYEKNKVDSPRRDVYFKLLDWLDWSLSMNRRIPLMTTARRSLTLYRNLNLELLKRRQALFQQIEELGEVDESLVSFWKNADVQMIKNVRNVKVSALMADASFGENTDGLRGMLDNLRMIHQILYILEQEMARVSGEIYQQLQEGDRSDTSISIEDLAKPALQLEAMLRRCELGVQTNSILANEYTPLASCYMDRLSEEDIDRSLDKLFQIFPDFLFPLQTFSFRNPLTYRLKDFNEDFTPQNVATKIRRLRQEFSENSDAWGKIKILLMPGLGAGSYSEQTQTLLVPAFKAKSDFDCDNFLTALADYLLQTRPKLSAETYVELFERLKKSKSLPPQLSARHQLQILSLTLKELIKMREGTESYLAIQQCIKPLFTFVPESMSEDDLDEALLELIGNIRGTAKT